MYFAGDLSKTSKLELLHLKEILYWHRAGSGIQETFNRMKRDGKKYIHEMDTDTVEVWTSTMLALAMQHSEKREFWLGRPLKDPPDMAVMAITERGYFHAREIEVTRCRHANEELTANILKKDAENNLSEKYIVCGFVEVPGRYDLVSMSENLQRKLKRIKNVVLVLHGIAVHDANQVINENQTKNLWTVVQMTPVFDAITIDITTEYHSWLAEPDKLRYVKDAKIYAGKRGENEIYPTLLPDTPLDP